ncbi:hypothetical protein Oscil6304_2130 [Oscillatoria acuminata PCC 6304]|uniref:Uncharacterized protein n=1 Tax=Oscillatoria acuminata PCC 6304 TaxID=56110 RepID=K9TIG1_9CYAN|nr:hypothetical protein Oscil6304_2130 [Oscillatoria acuminata PCC 6304]
MNGMASQPHGFTLRTLNWFDFKIGPLSGIDLSFPTLNRLNPEPALLLNQQNG